jgi:hypothetical protein
MFCKYLRKADSLKAGGWVEGPNLEAGHNAEVAGNRDRRPRLQQHSTPRVQRGRTRKWPRKEVEPLSIRMSLYLAAGPDS